jgi:hypothetical protein
MGKVYKQEGGKIIMSDKIDESLQKKYDVGKIPDLKKEVEKLTTGALVEMKDAIKEGIINKQEIIRDIPLSIIPKLQSLWDKIKLIESDEQTLRKYSGWFVTPLVELLDLARKANVDIYEMRYGKKIQINKTDMKFEDFVKAMKEQVMSRPENQVIDIKVEKDGNNDK